MSEIPKELTDSLEKPHSKNEGKKRLTKLVALVALGASVGLTAQVNAGPTVEAKKAPAKVDAKELKVQRHVDTKKIKNIDARKIDVKKVKEVNRQFEPDSGPKRPPPP